MFKVREDEPAYARLPQVEAKERNIHDNPIDLIACSTVSEGTSLFINADAGVGDTANRNKQHGFHFTADNCIGCHACEAACSEKNDLPPHLSFRSVGYVEGGTYPAFTRMNISMACNHCDDPVCLKGCPTNAYTKHSEYGAVLQDPDTCFGCGYCTWVCPYNAPQLDPVEGHVQKCNMCVDRLEVGLKPACVSACVGNALDFGVIESTPENREQIKTSIPGFPDTSISKPNIRFQQTKSMPREFTRTDSEPIKYHRNDKTNSYDPVVDLKKGRAKTGGAAQKFWNLGKLNSRENPLVFFTLITQAVIGAFAITFLGAMAGLESMETIRSSSIALPFVISLTFLQALVLFVSTQHLGKPLRFYRGFNNLRYSPLSREALAVAIFFGFLAMVAGVLILEQGYLDPWFEVPDTVLDLAIQGLTVLGTLFGVVGLYYMHCIYRIKARPFWNHWQVLTSFFGSMFSVGGVLIGLLSIPLAALNDIDINTLISELMPFIALGLVVETLGHFCHARDLQRDGREGAASFEVLRTQFGKTYILRNALIGFWVLASCIAVFATPTLAVGGWVVTAGFIASGIGVLMTSLVSRALFYVIVIPTTMPGAFFWKNKGFEEHARETGLADMPQVGVAQLRH